MSCMWGSWRSPKSIIGLKSCDVLTPNELDSTFQMTTTFSVLNLFGIWLKIRPKVADEGWRKMSLRKLQKIQTSRYHSSGKYPQLDIPTQSGLSFLADWYKDLKWFIFDGTCLVCTFLDELAGFSPGSIKVPTLGTAFPIAVLILMAPIVWSDRA